MTTDQKGTTQMTQTSNLSAFAYHVTLPDGTVRTIKAATRRYTHVVAVQYGDRPDSYSDSHPERGAWRVSSDHSSEALAQKAARKLAAEVTDDGAVRIGADGYPRRTFLQVQVVPFDNLRPEDMPEPTPEADDLTALDPCPSCGAERLEWMTGRLFCQACGVDAHAAHAERRHVTVAEAAKAVRATSEAEQGPVADEPEAGVDYPADVPAQALMDARGQIVALQDALERSEVARGILREALDGEAHDHSRQAQALMAEVADAQRHLENAKAEAECLREQRDAKGARLERYQRLLSATQAVAIDLGYGLLRTSHAPANLARQGIEAKLGEVGLRLTTQHGVADEYADPAANPYESSDETMVGLGEIDGSGE